jgi:hypothetical protein
MSSTVETAIDIRPFHVDISRSARPLTKFVGRQIRAAG